MSSFTPQYKDYTYQQNLELYNQQKERRLNEALQEKERDKIAMDRLQNQIEQEKKLEKERKNQIRQQQYEDYSNYMKQKYSNQNNNQENMNIKLNK